MPRTIPRSYTDEFKLEAVKLAEEVGSAETFNRLGIPESILSNWLGAWRKQKLFKEGGPKAAPAAGSVAALQAELNRLRRENANLKVDVEILKKATAYFVKGSK